MTETKATTVSGLDLQRWQKAQQDLLKGRPDRALSAYHALAKKYSENENLRFELGLAAAKELDFDQAVEAFQRTAELSAGNVSLRILLGQQFHLLRQMDQARESFEAAAKMDSASVPAQLSLAEWYERERRLEDAWTCIESCAHRNPADAQVRCFQALLWQRKKNYSAAEKILRDIIASHTADLNAKISCRHQLAVVLDETGRYAEALACLAESKTLIRQAVNFAKLQQTYEYAERRRRELQTQLTQAMIREWRGENSSAPLRPRLAFLGGHPRSGTTLLEQILGAHPAITAFDEPMAFTQEILEQLAPLENAPTLTAEVLHGVNESRRKRFRERYLKNLGRENRTPGAEGVVLDKNPSHTASVHLWLRIFPEVKVIISLRDPRDVIVSCYFQNLALNVTNSNFLTLERTVKHYTDLMDAWLRMRQLGGFDWIETRYEDIVAEAATEGRRVTEFLGLDWSPQQAAHDQAERKTSIVAPNYHEVARPIYKNAVGRWRNYAEALEPFQKKLAPYCRAFGYE